ncbi:MAG: hypothetical protein ACAI44_25265 [Candidatus Sericytochromatia bacterium]
MGVKTFLPACLGLSFLLATGPAGANDTSFSLTGGVPRILTETHIAMQAEKLEFRHVQPAPPAKVKGECPDDSWDDGGVCHPKPYWQADLSYTFVNRGPARTLSIGLPFDMPECGAEYDVNGPCLRQGVLGLTTSVDGQPFKVSARNVNVTQPVSFNRIYLVTVPFAKGQTRVLRHRYRTHVITSVAGQRFRYLLRTGSTWAGPIGKVEIGFELPTPSGPCATANLPYSYDGRWLRISLENWKPDRDLDIVFADPGRALLGTGVSAWADTLADVCSEAEKLDADERKHLADRIELLYGAPQQGREAAFAEGPLPMCSSADYFSMIANRDENFMPHPGLSGLKFLTDPAFPGNMPPLLRQCVQALRK